MTPFTPSDLAFLQQRGSTPEQVEQQLELFSKGFGYADIDRPAVLGDGILKLEEDEIEELAADYIDMATGKKAVKFVPASGAASRMFKDLFLYLTDKSEESRCKALQFLADLPQYPFYEALDAELAKTGHHLDQEIRGGNVELILNCLLQPGGLNYSSCPKGLLPFHRYADRIRTALEEHLVEAARYAAIDGHCHLHFTVSPQHKDEFEAFVEKTVPCYEERYHVKYTIDFSVQDPSTDTIAVNPDNSLFRDENGHLLFRPGGHGALIHNLNRLDCDFVFIKNIDNVVPERDIEVTVTYKKALAAYMLQLQNRLFQYLHVLENGKPDNMMLCEMLDFAETELMISLDGDFTAETLYKKMNRPLRVCGMVKNEGEPGGGPFWVCNKEGDISLQIVESSQIDKSDPEQKQMMQLSTHFNPVDMVCALKDYKGQAFDLLKYVDPNTGFISSKSVGSHTVRAMELPGLWNGAMSDWITVFVEVPAKTFNPVKTVFNLRNR